MVMLWVALGLCFVGIAVGVYAATLSNGSDGDSDVVRQVNLYRPDSAVEAAGAAEGGGSLVSGVLSVSQRLVSASGKGEDMAAELLRAGWRIQPHEWTLIRGLACLAATAGLWIVSANLFASLLIGFLAPFVISRFLLSGARSRRLNAFADQLPDALAMIASSLRAGFTVSQSLERLAQQDTEPLGSEMARALAQTRIGVSIEDALDQVADRMECPDMHWVVMTIRIQREVGGNLAEVIETTMETMRERSRLRRHVRALSAEGRLSAYVLIALPILLCGGMMIFNPEYLAPLFDTPLGLGMLIAAGFSLALGWFWISNMIKIDG
jgi:tight adherence protein B